MLRLLVQILFSIRNVIFKVGKTLFESCRDSKTGKLKYLKPQDLKVVLFLMFLIMFFLIFILAQKKGSL